MNNIDKNFNLLNYFGAEAVIFVRHPKCKIDLVTNVIALDFDVISGRITKVEFGNFRNELKNLLDTVNTTITEKVEKSAGDTTAKLEKELTEATNKIRDHLGGSYVIYEGDRILIADRLPKEEAIDVIMINNGGLGFLKRASTVHLKVPGLLILRSTCKTSTQLILWLIS